MGRRVALIHTVSSLMAVFKALCDELMPDEDIFNVVDESLLQDCIREGRLSTATARRLIGHLISAQQAGANVAMVTCSSMGPAVEIGRPLLDIPVLRVDEPMAEQAAGIGARIGVAATLRTTLEPTVSLIQSRAAVAGREVEVTSLLCEGAFDAIIKGDLAKHDTIVSAGLAKLAAQVDVIVLAQASMARALEGLPEADGRVPVLSSPRLAVERLAKM